MAKIIGTRFMDFQSREGKRICGANVWMTSPFPVQASGCSGVQCDKVWISDEALTRMGHLPDVGADVEPVYNKYGKVVDFL